MPAIQREHNAQPGDLIKIIREWYQHCVVYIGDDEVVGLPGPIGGDDGGTPCLVNGEAEVTREKIWDVIQDDKFRVYNAWDEKYEPRNKEIIIKEACERVGEKLEFNWSTYNSEHFAKELRYGKQMSRKDLPVSWSETHNAKPGDLIEIFRWGYQHWVVYVGNDEVVGLTGPENGDGVFQNMINGKAEVKREKIWDVVGQDQSRVNNLWDTKYEPREVAVILKETLACVGQTQTYSLFSHNCEHFATEQRYGKAKSWQVIRASWIVAIIGALGLGGIITCSICKFRKQSTTPLMKQKVSE